MLTYSRGLFSVAVFAAASAASSFAQTPKAAKPTKPFIDPKAETLLQNVADRLRKANSVSGKVSVIIYSPDIDFGGTMAIHQIDFFRAQKPNLLFNETRSETSGLNGKRIIAPFRKAISDGKRGVDFYYMDASYGHFPPTQSELSNRIEDNFLAFFAPANYRVVQAETAKSETKLVSLQMAPDKMYHGIKCSVVVQKNITSDEVGTRKETVTTYLGKDGLPRGFYVESRGPDELIVKVDAVIKELVFNRALPASAFAISTKGFKYSKPIVVPDLKDEDIPPINLSVKPHTKKAP